MWLASLSKYICCLPIRRWKPFLVIADSEKNNEPRHPHHDIAGKIKITGNIIDTAPETNWNLPRSIN